MQQNLHFVKGMGKIIHIYSILIRIEGSLHRGANKKTVMSYRTCAGGEQIICVPARLQIRSERHFTAVLGLKNGLFPQKLSP